jgi:hypothetical protein
MPTNSPHSADDWPDAHIWAKKSKLPLYFFLIAYGGGAIAVDLIMIFQGRFTEVIGQQMTFLNVWALFACLFSWWGLSTIERARKHISR